MWTQQKTRRGDTLVGLARAYGTSVDAILLANDVMPCSRHTDRYLAEKAREYLIPSNLPRAQLSKLVQEYDVMRWARALGAECPEMRHGSQTQVRALLNCHPGGACRFDEDCEIVLPMKARKLAGFSGLGAVTSVDLARQLEGARVLAGSLAGSIVNSVSALRLIDKPRVEAWRTTFVQQVNRLVEAALGKDSSGRHNFERNPALVDTILRFVQTETDSARREFSFSAQIEESLSSLRTRIVGISNTLRAAAAPVATDVQKPGVPPPQAKTTFTTVSTTLADVRAGRYLVKGNAGPGVRELQALLVKKGHNITVDGLFGDNTERAIRTFQQGAKIAMTGRLDPLTLKALEAPMLPVPTSVSSASTSLTLAPQTGGLPVGLLVVGAIVIGGAAVALSD